MVNAAIAELKTERFGPERDQIAKAAALLDRALTLDASNLRAKFYHTLVLRADGKVKEAAEILSLIAATYPRDREIQRQLGQTLYSLGRLDDAQRAFEAILSLDPTDAHTSPRQPESVGRGLPVRLQRGGRDREHQFVAQPVVDECGEDILSGQRSESNQSGRTDCVRSRRRRANRNKHYIAGNDLV